MEEEATDEEETDADQIIGMAVRTRSGRSGKIVQYDPNRQGGEKNCPVADVLGVNIASSTEVSYFH